MTIQKPFYTAYFGVHPFPVSYDVQGKRIDGVREDAQLIVNGQAIALNAFEVAQNENVYTLRADGYVLNFDVRTDDHAITYTVSPDRDSRPVEYIGFAKMPFFAVDGSFSYARDRYMQQQWHSPIGRGLQPARFESGPVHGAWPESQVATVHACVFKEDVCCFVRTDYAVEPLTVAFEEDSCFPHRSGKMTMGLNKLYFDLRDKKFDKWTFGIHLIGDLNGDGLADECDYQLAMREYLPEPCPIYKDAVWYKIMCCINGETQTTFRQALEIIAYISSITQNAKQIAYLVGWQDKGHDSNYPSFNIINPDVGTREEFLELIDKAKKLYNCTVSVHINVDDSYPHNPGWREDLISRDIDGKPMTWEIFLQKQSYHINHTKDVRSGDIFRRLDEFLNLVPITESIHIDAFRNMNYSWEEDEFIGPDKEFYCGQKEILAYLAVRGIDVTTEALNGMMVEASGTFSGMWHMFSMLPILYQNKIYGGGSDDSPARIATGSSLNGDITYADYQSRISILRPVVMRNMLYRYLLTKKMVEHRTDGMSWRAHVRYADGTTAHADNGCNYLEITTEDGVTIATEDTRMIPLDGGLYVYQTKSGWLRRKLPKEFRGKPLRCRAMTKGVDWPEYQVEGDVLHVKLEKDMLMFFTIDETRL